MDIIRTCTSCKTEVVSSAAVASMLHVYLELTAAEEQQSDMQVVRTFSQLFASDIPVDDKLACQGCKSDQNFVVRTSMKEGSTAPPYIIMPLNVFHLTGRQYRGDAAAAFVPHRRSVDVTDFDIDDVQIPRNGSHISYKVIAVVCSYGSRANNGHYWCWRRLENSHNFIVMNDAHEPTIKRYNTFADFSYIPSPSRTQQPAGAYIFVLKRND